MADPTKHLHFSLISEIKNFFSIARSRRTVAFAYGFMFAFVAFTIFLAFNPSASSATPFYRNVFAGGGSDAGAATVTTQSYRSQFASIFSYLFPNASSQPPLQNLTSQPQSGKLFHFDAPANNTRSYNASTTRTSPVYNNSLSVNSETQSTVSADQAQVVSPNQSVVTATLSPAAANWSANSSVQKGKQVDANKGGVSLNAAVPSPTADKQRSRVENHTATTATAEVSNVSGANQANNATSNRAAIPTPTSSVASNPGGSSRERPGSSSVDNSGKGDKNAAKNAAASSSATPNPGVPSTPAAAAVTDHSTSSLAKSSNNPDKGDSGLPSKGKISNPTQNQSVGTKSQGMDSLVKSLMNCNLFDGEWVKDDSYPLYKPGSCSLIDEQFDCILNGRPDTDYQKLKWKPKGCTLPRLNASHMLEMLRGKRLVFVGDSLNRNMWESLVCILKSAVKDQSKVYEANGRNYFRGEASYTFIFEEYKSRVEFFVSPFLVREWEMPDKNGRKKETLRLDLVGKSCDEYKSADFIIFNTGHWWTHEKTSKGEDYYQEGSHVYKELNVLEAFRKALTTWARWVEANVNPSKSMVFFRGYSASHFSGGQWNSGGACDSETEPIKNETYLTPYPPKMSVLENVLKGMKTHVSYLNITRLTDYRKDGHPSIYRRRKVPDEEKLEPLKYQDCSHWCLPGVPDAWNELLYAELLVRHYQRRQYHQKRP